jgi:hypothetical protein
MPDSKKVLSREEMVVFYGDFYNMVNPKIVLEKNRCPKELHQLIPYAEFWGISDDLMRENLVKAANKDICDNLKEVVNEYDDLLDQWLAGGEAYSESPSKEYVAFSAMRMAADYL